ncbi:hypothetical protein SAMN05421759_10987 [Roseivivax lentus]|uniref:Uncharacterized protein n=2 Tax=Roseivivax lentus TaxID=633194 RepID=A0A1N7NPN3_9RHOB|nr:hypothetical protein SAMN05421759_10987 [Roseivivax lentus]
MSDLDDVAEDYLRENIDDVWADIAKKKRVVHISARRSDAALIQYIVAYLAAHPDPQLFLRNLQTAISGLGSHPQNAEPTDA